MNHQVAIKNLLLQSLLVLTVLFSLLLFWSYLAPLQSASMAAGHIRVEGKRQSLKSVYPGMVESIHVEEGDTVVRGDLLVSLDSREDEIHLKRLLSELAQMHIAVARLEAYANHRIEIHYSNKVLSLIKKMNLQSLMLSSERVHLQQMDLLNNKNQMMTVRQKSQLAQIEGKAKTQRSLKIQMGMTERERKSAQVLVEKHYLSENRLIDFDRDVEQLNSRLSEISTESHMAGQSLQEMQINQQQYEYSERFITLSEMYRLQARQPQIESQVNLLRLRISRASLRSPVSGRVVNRRVNTVGASVESGQLLLELVPAHDRLVLDVRLDPKDIEHVRPGSLAKVRFLAYSPRQYAPVPARVDTVAADVSLDKAGNSYYSVTLLPDTALTEMAKSLQLYPGMPAEATILTGSRTLMDYLLSPLINLRDRSLRER